MNQITDLKMAVNETFSSIISEIQLSNINFSVQITPFSAYITLKKSVIKDQNGNHAFPSPPILFLLQQAQQTISELREENDLLKIRSDAAENNYENLTNENAALVEAIAKFNNNIAASDASYNTLHAKLKAAEAEIIKIRSVKNSCEAKLKDTKKSHQHKINNANSIIKSLEKGDKCLKKEIHDLKRNLETTRDKLQNLKTDHSSLKVKKTKLESEKKKLEKVVSSQISKLSMKDINENNEKFEDLASSSSTLSLSSSLSSRSELESQSSPNLTAFGPAFTSMISHWNPLPVNPSPLPDSITTMVSHCIRLVKRSSLLCSAQDSQEMIERAFANFIWRPLAEPFDEQINP